MAHVDAASPADEPARADAAFLDDKLGRASAAFLDAFRRVNAANDGARHVRPTPLSVSTITFTGRLSVPSVPIDDVRLAVELAEAVGAPFEFALDDGGGARARKRARAGDGDPGARRFRYQLPLRRNGKSLKVFHNGSVHATGCTSPAEFLDMMAALRVLLADFVDARVVDFDTQLINAMFSTACPATGRPLTVAPRAFRASLPPAAAADLDTERHPSVKLRVVEDGARVATVCVFQTGNVGIMGAKTPAHVALAYETVVAALDAAAPLVCARDPRARVRGTTAKQLLVLVDGYPMAMHACCLTA